MTSQKAYLPYGRHSIDEDDIAAVIAALRSNELTAGPLVTSFEDALLRETDGRYAIACNSGTAALHLAMLGLDLKPGEQVIVPAITFLATANAVRLAGGEVVFADVDPATGLMTKETFAAAIDRSTPGRLRAVVPVFMAGQCHDPEGIEFLARKAGLSVIEDAAHALGTLYASSAGDALKVGCNRHSVMTCFSFHPVKTIAMGEGGAITTGDAALAERLRRLRSHGMVRDWRQHQIQTQSQDPDGLPNPWYYEMPEIGLNYRVPDILCALGISQMRKLAQFVERRQQLVNRYMNALVPFAPNILPIGQEPGCRSAWHIFVVRIRFDKLGIRRGTFMRRLQEAGIGSQVHYVPLYRQPYYRGRYGDMTLPGAETYYNEALTLPLFPQMDDADVDRVCQALIQVGGLV